MNKRIALFASPIPPAIAAVSLAGYAAFGLGCGILASAACAISLFALWPAFSLLVSRISGIRPAEIFLRDSVSYLAFALLLLWPISSRISTAAMPDWGGFDAAGLAANLFLKLLLALSLVLFVAVKALALPEKVHESIAARLPRAKPKNALVLMCLAYFAVMFSLSVIRFFTFKTPSPDLWLFNQAMWNTLHGAFMVTTRTLELGNQVVLGDHFFLILVFILPLYALFQHPLGLYLIESALITVAAIPLYWIARSKLGSAGSGLVFAAAFLLFPALQFVHLTEFQPVAFTIPFLLFAFHYLQQNRLRLFALFTALALFVRETQAPVVFLFGVYIALAMRRYRLGAVVCVSAIAWLLLAVFVFIPSLGPSYQYIGGTQNAFPNLGKNTGEIISNSVSNPLLLVKEATTPQDLGYLALLFLPVCFFSLLSPLVLVPASVFAINLFSGWAPPTTIYFQYNAELIAFLFIAAVYGAHRLRGVVSRAVSSKKAHNAVLATLLASALVSAVLFGPSPLSLLDPAPNQADFSIEGYTITPHHRLLLEAVSSIPQQASVSCDSTIAAHLSSRREVYYFPLNLGSVDYVLVDTSVPEHDSNLNPQLLDELRNSSDFETLIDSDGILLLRRAND